MKNLIVNLLAFIMLCPFYAQAQRGEWREQMESQKIAFITKELDLSSKEAQEFWPIYNEHQEAKEKVLDGDRIMKTDIESLSEEEARAEIDRRLQTKYEMQQLDADYTRRYLDVISAKKVLTLDRAEREFRKEMLKRLRGNKPREAAPRMRPNHKK